MFQPGLLPQRPLAALYSSEHRFIASNVLNEEKSVVTLSLIFVENLEICSSRMDQRRVESHGVPFTSGTRARRVLRRARHLQRSHLSTWYAFRDARRAFCSSGDHKLHLCSEMVLKFEELDNLLFSHKWYRKSF